MTIPPAKSPSRSTLEAVPDRASRLLRGIAHNGHIRAALAGEGYEEADHLEGWRLFHAVCGFSPNLPVVVDRTAANAISELDRSDGPLLDKVDATLGHRYPAQRDFLLGGLSPAERAGAVANVKTVLTRLDTLGTSSDPDDQAAMARLTKVKIDAAERARLASLVTQAESFEATSAAAVETDETRWERLAPLHSELWAWVDEWSRAANRAISRRDWLVSLGLAKRRSPAAEAPSDGDLSDAPPA